MLCRRPLKGACATCSPKGACAYIHVLNRVEARREPERSSNSERSEGESSVGGATRPRLSF
jgi:hypothetical protein